MRSRCILHTAELQKHDKSTEQYTAIDATHGVYQNALYGGIVLQIIKLQK